MENSVETTCRRARLAHAVTIIATALPIHCEKLNKFSRYLLSNEFSPKQSHKENEN